MTDRVNDAEGFSAGVKEPGLSVALEGDGDDEELDEAEEAGEGGDGEPRRVFFKHRRLQDQPRRPRQTVAD